MYDAVRFVETPQPDWIEAPAEHSGTLVVVCGLPGAGNTTLGWRLEVEHAAVRLCPDEWMAALDVDVFDERTRTLVEQLQWQLAQRLLQLGQLIVIEWGTWARDERDALRTGAPRLGRPSSSVSLISLTTCCGTEFAPARPNVQVADDR